MKNNTILWLILAFALLFPILISAQESPEATAAQRSDYPQRLLDEFPVIYNDTAYTSEDCNIVVKAVWMSRRHHKVKVSSPDQLPEPRDGQLVKFVPGCMDCQDQAIFQTEAMVTQRK